MAATPVAPGLTDTDTLNAKHFQMIPGLKLVRPY